jgi:hypothetical protein
MLTILAALDPERIRPYIDDVLWAARQIGIPSEEKLAMFLGIDKGLLHRQLHADGHFSFSRLAERMDPLFWAYLGWRLCLRHGLPIEAVCAAKIQSALSGHKRMSKAQLRQEVA